MIRTSNNIYVMLPLIVMIGAFVYYIATDTTVIGYTASCDDSDLVLWAGGRASYWLCKTPEQEWMKLTKYKFTISEQENNIVYQYRISSGEEGAGELQECDIKNKNNWSCTTESVTGKKYWSMENGKLLYIGKDKVYKIINVYDLWYRKIKAKAVSLYKRISRQ